MKRSQPKYFSDHFNIDKSKLKELGVFDPILNFIPEFSKMVDFVKKQQEKVVVLCYCVDRLQRDFDEQYFELQKLIKLGKLEIHFIKNEFIEHKDMDSSAKFRKNLDVLLANDYRNKISDNVKRSNRKKLEEGTILGDSPIGYLNTKR